MKFKSLFIVLLGIAAVSGCKPRYVSVEGHVRNSETSEPVAGAAVLDNTLEINNDSEGREEGVNGFSPNHRWVKTDSTGYFRLERVLAREHSIFFGAADYEPDQVLFKAKGRASEYQVDVELDRKPIEVNF